MFPKWYYLAFVPVDNELPSFFTKNETFMFHDENKLKLTYEARFAMLRLF